jgi:two-component system, OmpR family, sensor histidine kinase KdpD
LLEKFLIPQSAFRNQKLIMNDRPNPDQLLNRIQEEEKLQKRQGGFLKVFLGFVAGVGKTYRMLNEAQALKEKGEDVIIGIVETHGRSETEELTVGLDRAPLLNIDYNGIILNEFNLDFILQRKPKYVLVDELAHTNVPGTLYTKRFLDVEELLNAGINVYTTLNIQHIESVNDIIYQITKIEVKETVPDRILDRADKIELVDLPIEELLQRLEEGKVYIPDMAKLAAQNYFKEGTLLALRELALRYTAKHVDTAMLSYMKLQGIKGPWPVGSRILVCVSPSPLSEQPIRVGQRLADDLKAEWYAVFVESPRLGLMPEVNRLSLEKNFRLAEGLGAKVVRLSSNKPSEEILSFARSKNVTLIIIGFSLRSRFQQIMRGSLLNEIIDKSAPIQVLVVGDSKKEITKRPKAQDDKKKYWQPLGMAFFSVAITTGICLLLKSSIGVTNIALLYLIPIVLTALLSGLLGGITASLLAVVSFDFLFVPPVFSFTVYDIRYLPTFIVLLFIGIVTSFLADNLKKQTEASKNQAKFISLLYEFSRDLFYAIGLVDLLDRITSDISSMFNCEVAIILPNRDNKLVIKSKTDGTLAFKNHEMSIVSWVYEHQQPAGRGTETLTSSSWRFIPLNVKDETLGIIALGKLPNTSFLSLDQEYLLESFLSVATLAIKNYSIYPK